VENYFSYLFGGRGGEGEKGVVERATPKISGKKKNKQTKGNK
jgi:hypothetical protein